MNPICMKKLFAIILCFNLYIAVAQEKSYLDFINNMTPTFPGCEKANDKSECYKTNIGSLILSRVNAENSLKTIEASKAEIELLIRTENDGKSTIVRLITEDPIIKKLAYEALEKMPLVKPLYSEEKGEYVVSSQGLRVTLQKNNENKFELAPPKNKEDLSLKPYPNTQITKQIDFQNCGKVALENFSKCFSEQLSIWLGNNIEANAIAALKGQKAILKMTFDPTGSLKATVISESPEMKNVLENVLKTFPKVKPAEMSGKKIPSIYSIPISF